MVLAPFMRVGVVGCGRVGRTICRAIDQAVVLADLAAVCDTNASRAQSVVFELKRPTRSMSLSGLVASVDLVVEATNRHSAPEVMMAAMHGGKDMLVTNPAAVFARDDFARLAHDRGLTIYCLNTLLTGRTSLDTAAASAEATATLTLTCPVTVLAGAPFLRERQLQVANEPQLVFQGEGMDAMSALPSLANLIASAIIGGSASALLVRVLAHAGDTTDITLEVNLGPQRNICRASAPASGADPVQPEVTGMVAVGVLKSLVTALRLA